MERLHGLLEIQDSLKDRTLERKVTRETKHLEKLESWGHSNPRKTEPLCETEPKGRISGEIAWTSRDTGLLDRQDIGETGHLQRLT